MATGPQQVPRSQQLVGPALGGTGGPGTPLQSAGSELGGVHQHGSHINPAQPHPAHNNGVQLQSFRFNYSHSSGMQAVDYYGTSSIVGNQLSRSAKTHTSVHGDDGNASSIPGAQLAAAFSKTQTALVSSDSDAVKSGDPIAGRNRDSTCSKPRTLSELINQIDYIVEETLKKHILPSSLNIPFPDDCVVKVAGTTEWIDANVCERYFNFKFRQDITNKLCTLEPFGYYKVRVTYLKENKYGVVGLRVFYDYLGYRNRLEVVYIELDRTVLDDDYPVPTFTDFLS